MKGQRDSTLRVWARTCAKYSRACASLSSFCASIASRAVVATVLGGGCGSSSGGSIWCGGSAPPCILLRESARMRARVAVGPLGSGGPTCGGGGTDMKPRFERRSTQPGGRRVALRIAADGGLPARREPAVCGRRGRGGTALASCSIASVTWRWASSAASRSVGTSGERLRGAPADAGRRLMPAAALRGRLGAYTCIVVAPRCAASCADIAEHPRARAPQRATRPAERQSRQRPPRARASRFDMRQKRSAAVTFCVSAPCGGSGSKTPLHFRPSLSS